MDNVNDIEEREPGTQADRQAGVQAGRESHEWIMSMTLRRDRQVWRQAGTQARATQAGTQAGR